jgi:hypothetical protein
MNNVKVNGLTLHVGPEEWGGESPRETHDNLGGMLTWHRRYSIGDKNPYAESQDFWDDENLQNEIFAIVKVHMLDHSGLRLSNGPFASDPDCWDSGVVGIVYATKENVLERYGDLSGETRVKVETDLCHEIEDYDDYLNAEYYCFWIEGPDGESLDSCGGFGYDDKTEMLKGMKEYVAEEYYPLFDKAIAQTNSPIM